MEEPLDDGNDEPEVYRLDPHEEEDVRADLLDLSGMREVFGSQGVKGVVIACPDCKENHFYEWELLKDNLEHMLQFGEPRMHEPAFEVREDEYVQWDYAKGYIDALSDNGLESDRRVEITRFVVDACVVAEFIEAEPDFLTTPCNADGSATFYLSNLTNAGADRTRRGRYHDRLATLRLSDFEKPEIGG